MRTAIFFILDEYADWEGAYLSSQLNQDQEWKVKTASIKKEVISIGGFKTVVDYQLEQIPNNIDLLVLIGGNSWSLENNNLRVIIKNQLKLNKPVGAICGAVDYLAKNGLLTSFKHTGNTQYLWKNFEDYQNTDDFIGKQVVRDQNLVTANGTAPMEFTQMVLKMIHFKNNTQIDKDIDLYKLGFYQYCTKYGNPFS
ncbi:type 1 glutamine amidotransferase family protein [Lactobacillus sp. UCMA15818]|uniref:type 1 glutamine amidotransferase family protein n=1 Tax=Lactobacillus sp. UCMA15818 TaxID=2583394 RepID=UPI0025B10DBF|nr:type 1 glutamine amidotransferase family protein [Lactobacillus sp. UCMA15818]MDN2452212.1 glutamine amidotransferase [Lactobacillus sp. UCMA15818]